VVRVGACVKGVDATGFAEVYKVVGSGRVDLGNGRRVGWEEVMVTTTVVDGIEVGAVVSSGELNNVEEDAGITGGIGEDCDSGVTRETGKDCEKRGEEAGRLEGRYEVSKVEPPGTELGGVYVAVLSPGIPTENELETGVGMMVKDGLLVDATPPTVLLEGEPVLVL